MDYSFQYRRQLKMVIYLAFVSYVSVFSIVTCLRVTSKIKFDTALLQLLPLLLLLLTCHEAENWNVWDKCQVDNHFKMSPLMQWTIHLYKPELPNKIIRKASSMKKRKALYKKYQDLCVLGTEKTGTLINSLLRSFFPQCVHTLNKCIWAWE